MIPIPLIIDAVCTASGFDRAELVTANRACYARMALVQLLQDRRNMSVGEAAEYTNYSRTGFVTRRLTAGRPQADRILAEAKWYIEKTDRPVGRNVLVQWPPPSATERKHHDV